MDQDVKLEHSTYVITEYIIVIEKKKINIMWAIEIFDYYSNKIQ